VEVNPGPKADMTEIDEILAYVRHLGMENRDIIGLLGQQRNLR
jgi:hypothetical protein